MTGATPAPYWAPLIARQLMTHTQLGIRAPAYDYTLGHTYVVDPNPPATRVPLDANTWQRTCQLCGWPLHPHLPTDTHPTCAPDAPLEHSPEGTPALAESERSHRAQPT